jgi:hypothetical protein
MSRVFVAALLLMATLLCVRPAAAQECGDADGSGSVGVSDGVQTLRAAAGLDSSCTTGVCDMDGSGAITVTDGVSVLRKAAGLAVTENCSGGGGGQPATVLKEIQPLLNVGVAYATGTPVTACGNAPEGELEVATDDDGTTTTFFGCQFGDVHLYGDITVGTTLLTFSFFEADTLVDEDFIADYDGELALGTSGTGRSLSGAVDITTESASGSVLIFNNAVVTDGRLSSGGASLDLTESDISDSFTGMTFTFDGSGVANVTVTQSNGSTQNLRYDIATGAIVP